MDQKLLVIIRATLVDKSTEELRKAYDAGNLSVWSLEAFEAMRQILSERGETGLGPLPTATRLFTPLEEMNPIAANRFEKSAVSSDPMRARRDRRVPGRLASRETRLAAALIDGVVALLALGPGLIVYASSEHINITGITLLIVGAVALAICQWTLLVKRGQTIGKYAMNVRIVRYTDGSNPGFVGAVFLRSIVPGLIGAIPCIGSLFGLADELCIFGDDCRCLHDYIAGTKVVEA
ncbi:MAG: RDD family protein [Planctomycetes bacterium]|nr:RDD family protein [Planctomycetota bacterium]